MPTLLKFKFSRSSSKKDVTKDLKSIPAPRRFSEPALGTTCKKSSDNDGHFKHRKFSLNRLIGDSRNKLPSVTEERSKSHDCPTRSATCSGALESLADQNSHEWRLSEIAQLDSYMKYACQTPHEDDLTYLPNRLCCAQMLKVFFWREEQKYMNDLLHGRRTPGSRSRHHFNHFTQVAGSARKPAKYDTIVEQNSDETKVGKKSNNDDVDEIERAFRSNCIDDENAEPPDDDDDNDDDFDEEPEFFAQKQSRRKSIPVFPQRVQFDIY